MIEFEADIKEFQMRLVKGGAGRGEGAGSVFFDPSHLLSHPFG